MWYVIRYLRQKRMREHQRRGGTAHGRDNHGQLLKRGGPPLTLGAAVWQVGVPFLSIIVLAAAFIYPMGMGLALLAAATLCTLVMVAVHHAEVVAHRVGEPFGTLVLALAVTVIESGLIASIMLSGGGHDNSALARDAVYATVMIACNGGIGLCLFVGTLRHFVMAIRVEGASPALSVLMALTTLSLILPTLTTTTAGATFSPSQLMFAGVASLVLYCIFVFVQTVRHRDYFLPVVVDGDSLHAAPPSLKVALTSLFLLCLSLVSVVGLAKSLAPAIQQAVTAAHAPNALVGVVIAMLVLMPETWAAARAAMRNRMQTSVNLLLGSALATIGLTIPTVAAISLITGVPLQLGLGAKETALLVLTFFISTTTLAGGRATVLHGAVHLVLFATFLFLTVVP